MSKVKSHYDYVVIGAGMSALAGGIRLGLQGSSVALFERHSFPGGLNSYYVKDRYKFDVGLHALTNFPHDQVGYKTPLQKVLRQLRISLKGWDNLGQLGSVVQFGEKKMHFANGVVVLKEEIARLFPGELQGFARLLEVILQYELQENRQGAFVSTRRKLKKFIDSDQLIDMLLMPLLIYGSSWERDLDWEQFIILFKSIFVEGFSRPRGGVRTVIRSLVNKLRQNGGELHLGNGVQEIDYEGDGYSVLLENGQKVFAKKVFSSAGLPETMKLLSSRWSIPKECRPSDDVIGKMSFTESIFITTKHPHDFGYRDTINFYSEKDSFTYAPPKGLWDGTSAVICCSNNYEGEELREGIFRVTLLANYKAWKNLNQEEYNRAKKECEEHCLRLLGNIIPEFKNMCSKDFVARDTFTPLTVERFTGHAEGAVYGASKKIYSGILSRENGLEGLVFCGTDQGYVGIVGSMVSGSLMANLHGPLSPHS